MVHLHDFLHRHLKRQSLRDEIEDRFNQALGRERTGGGNNNNNNNNADGVATVFSVVYVTMSPTFTGPTAGFVTQTGQTRASTVQSTAAGRPTADTPQDRGTDRESSQDQQTSTGPTNTGRTTQPTATVGTPIQQTRAQSASAASSASATPTQEASSQGMSGGAKAGLAFGIILALALVGGIIFFVIRRKKQKKEEEGHNLDNEKSFFAAGTNGNNGNNGNNAASNNRAPRLSLRPVTQFLPGIGEPKVTEMTTATGGLQPFAPIPNNNSSNNGFNRPRSHISNDAANPFGQHAERSNVVAADKAAENAPIPVPAMAARSGPPPAAAHPATDPFADKQPDARSISPEISPPSSMPGSPPKAEFGTAAAVAVAAPGSTSPKNQPNQPNNVHRVQLDFKPSMDDELELRAGQVVRVLHEYDDGWALCASMDRSAQGVAPRTCLSKLPIKPRPAGPPPGMRPVGRPQSPGMRNFSGPPTNGPRNPMYPAPLSPSMPNMKMTHGPNSPPQGRNRSHSQSQSMDYGQRDGSPQMHSSAFGPSPPRDHRRSASMGQLGLGSPTRGIPVRKPVPGQAM